MKKRPEFKKVVFSQEGKILVCAFLLFFVFLSILGYAFARNAVLGRTLLGAFIAHLFGGRAAGVGLCIAFGLGISKTILYNMFLEVLIVLFSFSLFLISINHYLNIKFLDRAIRNAERNAHRYEHVISRYGFLGVFIFVLIPLPITGPVVGSIIGHFLKFSLKKNFLAVFSGTFLAVVLWTVFFNFLSAYITKIQWIFAIILIIVLVYFSKHIVAWFSKNESHPV